MARFSKSVGIGSSFGNAETGEVETVGAGAGDASVVVSVSDVVGVASSASGPTGTSRRFGFSGSLGTAAGVLVSLVPAIVPCARRVFFGVDLALLRVLDVGAAFVVDATFVFGATFVVFAAGAACTDVVSTMAAARAKTPLRAATTGLTKADLATEFNTRCGVEG